MNILVTAIGSMSAACVLTKLKELGYYIVGCDIYPENWHLETKLCDRFYQAPYATSNKNYINFLLEVCKKEDIKYIIPLTDLEIDVINNNRDIFYKRGIILCMQSSGVLEIVRNKYKLFEAFKDDANVPSIKTSLLSELDNNIKFPCIAKPYNGRSSEGLIRNATKEQLDALENKDLYIIQEQISGNVFTVDYCRSSLTNIDCAVPRIELLRTINGAGTTVQMSSDTKLIKLTSYIGRKLNINGCINMEFIFNNEKYYIIDINPRFSAGIAFSVLSGYDMISNHLRCFNEQSIDKQIYVSERILIKKYVEDFF